MQRELNITHGQTLAVVIRGHDGEYFNGKAMAISSTNKSGPFDILPKHAHFISLIQNSLRIYKIDTSTKEITFSTAVLKVKDGIVEIYIGTKR